ncbi:tripartite tricarboxylate transporter substrate binding protein [Xenophilus arseniciresistens]|uniref:Tripartite tricarboxylate transporter substrate binding protein n=1 Tax=Xenophilus arseniciresistens TaxID=1283306 RepID=A0AAE3NBN3_9BURK|nr:tripartite tricarboxylate transporter substrate binding protein [Xenophilus arseniciresistens]MDA7417357.1 tripartite tricarboxylate transporter substrate binding protein [Xenophilus arseniciresistens]
MKKSSKKIFRALSAFALALLAPALALADYPERPVRIVVPFSAGGNIDLTARAISTGMSQALGQSVIVENKPGAGGMLGAEQVARAAPDGYTLLLASTGSLAAAPALYPKLGFDPVKDLAASRAITQVPLVLVLNPKLPVSNVKELIALAKSRGAPLTMASTGNGTSNHLAGELFQKMAGVQFTHVPYRGSSQALTDVLGGQVDLMFDNVPTSLPFIKSGRLKALGVTGAGRSPALPQLPTVAESGLAGFEASTLTGIALPTGVAPEVAERIQAAMAQAMAAPKVREDFAGIGAELVNLPPADFARHMRDEGRKWSQVVRDAGVRID